MCHDIHLVVLQLKHLIASGQDVWQLPFSWAHLCVRTEEEVSRLEGSEGGGWELHHPLLLLRWVPVVIIKPISGGALMVRSTL